MGRARYAADIHPAGVLYGKILRMPHPHARINRIDATRALALPGVRAVATAADLPEVSAAIVDQEEGGTVNYGFYSRNVMAREKVLYRGHALAAVAAISPHVAEEALSRIEVDYEVLPPLLDADAAMQDDAPILHDRLRTLSNPSYRAGAYGEADQGTTNPPPFEVRAGDVEQGFAQADVIVRRGFHPPPRHPGL